LAAIPRFPELKLFKNGLGNITRFTAAEFRHMMKQLVFVLDDLILAMHKSDIEKNEATKQDKKLVDLFVTWNNMYLFSRQEKFSHSDLNKFQVIKFILILFKLVKIYFIYLLLIYSNI